MLHWADPPPDLLDHEDPPCQGLLVPLLSFQVDDDLQPLLLLPVLLHPLSHSFHSESHQQVVNHLGPVELRDDLRDIDYLSNI